MWYSRILMLLGAVVMLSACGGGNGAVPPVQTKTTAPTPQVAGLNGIWDGSYNSNVNGQTCNDLQALIFNGQVRAVSKSCNMVLTGSLSIKGDIASVSFNSFSLDGSSPKGTAGFTGSFTGSFTAGSIIAGTYSTSGKDSGNFTLNYNIVYENNSSLSKVEGSWEYKSASDWIDLRISNVGDIVGADNKGCSYSGNISIIDPAYNLYAYKITLGNIPKFTSCPDVGDYTGVASLGITAGAKGSMTVLAGNDQNVFFADFSKATGTTN